MSRTKEQLLRARRFSRSGIDLIVDYDPEDAEH